MAKLSKSNCADYKIYPERILQFGDGNFLRAFVDWIVDRMNKETGFNSGVVVVGPRSSDKVYNINDQDGLYTLLINGIEKGEIKQECSLINCITRAFNTYRDYDEYLKTAENPDMRFVISNTTEAGIVYNDKDRLEDRPQTSFPGKLTAWLYHRYKTFNGDMTKGLLILPCELIDKNGEKLKEIINNYAEDWELEKEFINWINNANIFYNTLVDRIVPGYPKEKAKELEKELGYEDKYLVEGEYFHLWVIEGPKEIKEEFPADKIGLNVLFVDDLTPYRTRKVRILNGAHTSMVPVSYLYGIDTVKESVEDEVIGKYIESVIYDEIVPTLDLPEEELLDFSAAVLDRFGNPFIKHYLMSISLNSMSKFQTRVLPSILEYIDIRSAMPAKLLFALASLIYFYRGERDGEEIKLSDNPEFLNMYKKLWDDYDGSDENLESIAETVLGLVDLWKIDLNTIEGLKEEVTKHLIGIKNKGINEAVKGIL